MTIYYKIPVLPPTPFFLILEKNKNLSNQIKHMKCSEYFPQGIVCQSAWILSSNGFFLTFSNCQQNKTKQKIDFAQY